jgi:hypothetical protein
MTNEGSDSRAELLRRMVRELDELRDQCAQAPKDLAVKWRLLQKLRQFQEIMNPDSE